ncbi:hypothetical protein LB467_01525 [Salegentibacter sp. JZCK2]|uniref:hypothetical protein n=1 Tax=Salegentibacter tibetensis TaxID=2873600 RepID=UPI001CCF69C0|nr:hypothetical protein [Salegentibacter tibetensis]MBZ9728355.1 hypothetical protein [Salegentibacter tibetensis]
MKKFIFILVAVFTLGLYSCRETTKEKTEDAVESFGKDIEDNVNKAGEKVKEGAKKVEEEAKKVGKEIDEEIHEDDN